MIVQKEQAWSSKQIMRNIANHVQGSIYIMSDNGQEVRWIQKKIAVINGTKHQAITRHTTLSLMEQCYHIIIAIQRIIMFDCIDIFLYYIYRRGATSVSLFLQFCNYYYPINCQVSIYTWLETGKWRWIIISQRLLCRAGIRSLNP